MKDLGVLNCWAICCPYFIGCGNDDFDEKTAQGKKLRLGYGLIAGCWGITCIECWNKEAD